MGVGLVFAALSIGLGILSRLLYGDRSSPLDSDTPATTSARGSYVPLKIGRRLDAPIIAHVWDREVRKERAEGGKKGSVTGPPKVDVYYEAGWHLLRVGPVRALHSIRKNGKVIFQGPITPESTPSGSFVGSKQGLAGKPTAGNEGTFQIFWGTPDQPVNSLANFPISSIEKPLGIASRWPYCCYIVWYKKRLGQTPHWPEIKYELESYPIDSQLSGTPSVFPPTRTLSGTTLDVDLAVDGAPGYGYFVVDGDHTALFYPGGWLKLTGNAAPDGDYQVLDVNVVGYDAPLVGKYTIVYLQTELSGSDNAGDIEPYVEAEDDGINPAHAMGQVLFSQYPHGLGLRTNDEWDVRSLEEVGVLAQSEGLSSSVEALNGQTAKGLVSAILQDLGVMVPQVDGVTTFLPVREVDETAVPTISEDAIVPQLASRESSIGPLPSSAVVFRFKDRTRAFRDGTVRARNDGEARVLGHHDTRDVPMAIPISVEVASKIAERRIPEEMGGQAAGVAIYANHGARRIVPGQAFRADGISGLLRCGARKIDLDSGKVRIDALFDRFSQPVSTLEHEGGGGTDPGGTPAAPDLLFGIFEVPSFISDGTQRLAIPRIRGDANQLGADFWLSLDDTTYVHVGSVTGYQTGGVLIEALEADGKFHMAEGPTFTPVGVDIATVPDQSADAASWGAGRVAVVFQGFEEICYLQKVTFVSGTTWRLDGLLRARQDTDRQAIPAGTPFFIVLTEDMFTFTDVLLAPGVTVYVKTQPFATESYPLQLVEAESKTLLGKGVIPMAPENVTTADLSASWGTGEDIALEWQFRSAAVHGTGAGMQGAGYATGDSPQYGSFELTFKATGGTVRGVHEAPGPNFTYTNAALVADFGSEPTAFDVEVRNVNGGYRSPAATKRITRT